MLLVLESKASMGSVKVAVPGIPATVTVAVVRLLKRAPDPLPTMLAVSPVPVIVTWAFVKGVVVPPGEVRVPDAVNVSV
jgi:hypothetical protein